MGESADPFKTMGMGAGETLRIDDFMASLKQAQAPQRGPGTPRARRSVDVEKYAARLRYLCHLIARDRQGLCPINGILVVLPVTAAEPWSSLAEIGSACKADLAGTFEVLRMRCPVLILLSDLDKLQGFEDLVERLPAEQRTKRMGQRFPLVPDLEPEAVSARIKDSVSWIGTTLFPSMVHSLFQTERPGVRRSRIWCAPIPSSTGSWPPCAIAANGWRSSSRIASLRCRASRSSIAVATSRAPGPIRPPGRRSPPGVLRLLIREQDNVTWTADAMAQDEAAARLARAIKLVLIGVIVLGLLVILVLVGWQFLFSAPGEAAN